MASSTTAKVTALWPRTMFAAVALLAASLAGFGAPHVSATAIIQNDCTGCNAVSGSPGVDPASYKLWPDGNKTFLNVHWSSTGGVASFDVRNFGAEPTPALTASVDVSDHDPISELPRDHTGHIYQIPPLAPGELMTVTVPLDPTQCDIWVTVDFGFGSPTVLRTGNPATC